MCRVKLHWCLNIYYQNKLGVDAQYWSNGKSSLKSSLKGHTNIGSAFWFLDFVTMVFQLFVTLPVSHHGYKTKKKVSERHNLVSPNTCFKKEKWYSFGKSLNGLVWLTECKSEWETSHEFWCINIFASVNIEIPHQIYHSRHRTFPRNHFMNMHFKP